MSSNVVEQIAALESERKRLESRLAADENWRALQAQHALNGSAPPDTAEIEQRLRRALAGNPYYSARLKIVEAITILRRLGEAASQPSGNGHATAVVSMPSREAPRLGVPLFGAEPKPKRDVQNFAAPVREEAPSAEATPTERPDFKPLDELTRIRGISDELALQLASQGTRRFSDIAQWSAADVRRFAGALGLGRRISKENWIEQAAILARSEALLSTATPPAEMVAKAAAAETAVADPVVAAQAAPEAAVVEPAVAEPGIAESIVAQPADSNTANAQPTFAEPIVVGSAVAEPLAAAPAVVETAVSEVIAIERVAVKVVSPEAVLAEPAAEAAALPTPIATPAIVAALETPALAETLEARPLPGDSPDATLTAADNSVAPVPAASPAPGPLSPQQQEWSHSDVQHLSPRDWLAHRRRSAQQPAPIAEPSLPTLPPPIPETPPAVAAAPSAPITVTAQSHAVASVSEAEVLIKDRSPISALNGGTETLRKRLLVMTKSDVGSPPAPRANGAEEASVEIVQTGAKLFAKKLSTQANGGSDLISRVFQVLKPKD